MRRNQYFVLGLVLCVSGAILAPLFYILVNSVPLTALAISAVMLGVVSAVLGSSRPDVSPEASQMMLRTGIENIAALLEELGLTSRAVYMPSAGRDRRARAMIPLSGEHGFPAELPSLSNRLVVRYGPNPEDIGLVVTTPGTMSLDGVRIGTDAISDEIGSALSQILVGTMDLADSVVVNMAGNAIVVEIANPKLRYENVWFYRCLGSPLASIAATVASQALNRAVIIVDEQEVKKRIRVRLEALR